MSSSVPKSSDDRMKGLCRACLGFADPPKPLFSEDASQESPAELVWKCTGVCPTKGDRLPESLCRKCFTYLSIAHHFWLLVQNSNSLLLQCADVTVQLERCSRIENYIDVTVEDIETEHCVDSEIKNEDIKFELADNTSDIDISEVKIVDESDLFDNFITTKPTKGGTNEEYVIEFDSDDSEDVKYVNDHFQNENQTVKELGQDRLKIAHQKYCTCLKCDKKFENKESPNVHTRIHQDPFRCNVCSVSFITRVDLKHHRSTQHPEKKYTCDCGFATHLKKRLSYHMEIHSTEMKFKCHLCEYVTNVKGNLKVHLVEHNMIKIHTCHLCTYSTRGSFDLKRHLELHAEG